MPKFRPPSTSFTHPAYYAWPMVLSCRSASSFSPRMKRALFDPFVGILRLERGLGTRLWTRGPVSSFLTVLLIGLVGRSKSRCSSPVGT